MNYNTIGITLCKKCTASCKICCISADPQCEEKLNFEAIKQYINSVKNIDYIKTISFTGGEIFLYYNELKELIKLTRYCGKQCTLITNGFWAHNKEITLEKLQELKQCGLDALTISYDEFHAEFVDVSNIKNILSVSRKFHIPVSLQTVIIKESKNSSWLNELNEELQDVMIDFIPCMPVGKAIENIKKEKYIKEYNIHGLYCRKSGAFSITSDGEIWPCCSPYITETALSLGNLKNNISAEETLEIIRKNIILYMLRNYGFDYFINIVVHKLKIDLPETVITSCELCVLLFNKENIQKFIPFIWDTIKEKQK